MPDGYDLAEGRFINFVSTASAADALWMSIGPVPRGKIWTILACCAVPSVNETRTWWFAVEAANSGYAIPVTQPASLAAVVASQLFPAMVREGMEFKLFPGERLYAMRDAATAGSTITLRARMIETDMPLYHYTEPQLRLRQRKAAAAVLTETAPGFRGGPGQNVSILGFPVGRGGGGAKEK